MEQVAPSRVARAARLHGIYAVLGDGCSNVHATAQAALTAGIRLFQYRRKGGINATELGALRSLTRDHDALLIVNDEWRVARQFACDGVHLGPGDEGFEDPQAIRDAWPGAILGISCGTPAEARAVVASAVDYLGVGPVYATHSKADAGDPIGTAGLGAIAKVTTLPICAIGGIGRNELRAVRRSGVAMAAMLSALAGAPDIGQVAYESMQIWKDEER